MSVRRKALAELLSNMSSYKRRCIVCDVTVTAHFTAPLLICISMTANEEVVTVVAKRTNIREIDPILSQDKSGLLFVGTPDPPSRRGSWTEHIDGHDPIATVGGWAGSHKTARCTLVEGDHNPCEVEVRCLPLSSSSGLRSCITPATCMTSMF